MASTPPRLPVSLCKQVTMDVALRLVWSVNAGRWSAGSGWGYYCRLQVGFGVLHSARLSLRPCIFHSSVLYSLCGSLEDSSLFHCGFFFFIFNFTWDFIFVLHHLHLLHSLFTPWHSPLLVASVMTLCIPAHSHLKKCFFFCFFLNHTFWETKSHLNTHLVMLSAWIKPGFSKQFLKKLSLLFIGSLEFIWIRERERERKHDENNTFHRRILQSGTFFHKDPIYTEKVNDPEETGKMRAHDCI